MATSDDSTAHEMDPRPWRPDPALVDNLEGIKRDLKRDRELVRQVRELGHFPDDWRKS